MPDKAETRLTVLVIMFNMQREAARTLYALTPRYQLGVRPEDYEVHVVDNGSDRPLDPGFVRAFGSSFRHSVFPADTPSPCAAINHAVAEATSPYVMVMIDGARIPSPGLLRAALDSISNCDHAFVYTIGMHLGSKRQQEAVLDGYDQAAEDRLLKTVNWQLNGYRLFDIAVPGGSCRQGFAGPISESNAFVMARKQFLDLGGFDQRFVSPGGGLANLELFNRVHQTPDLVPVLLLGEATFHQFHGGIASNAPITDGSGARERNKEYAEIIGAPFQSAWRQPLYFGRPNMPSAALFPPLPEIRCDGAVLVVLGMHRSGTSCLAGMLQSAGFASGTVDEWSSANQRGNRENMDIMRLNDAVLRRSGADWEHPPPGEGLLIDDRLRTKRTDVLAPLAALARPWMFKDPRTLLTLPFWREVFPNPRRIGIFRHPMHVAASLYMRAAKSISEGLALWLAYNRRLLAEHGRAPFPILCFDLPREDFLAAASRAVLSECGDLTAKGLLDLDRMRDFYTEELVHHRDGATLLQQMPEAGTIADSDEVLEVYNRLCSISGVEPASADMGKTHLVAVAAFGKLLDADRAVRDGQVDAAACLYREIAGVIPDPRLVWTRLVGLLSEHGSAAQALEAGEQALRACPSDPDLMLLVATAQRKLGRTEAALGLVEQALTVVPKAPHAWLRKGECLRDLERWEDAASALKQAVLLQSPGHFWAHAQLGEVLLRSGRREEGADAFERALGLAPQADRALVNHRWAQTLAASGDLRSALARQQVAAKEAPDLPHVQAALARLETRLSSQAPKPASASDGMSAQPE